MMLANRWNGRTDPTGWWASEKLDGCRAFWDGAVLRTRDSWLPIDAPAAITAKLPRGRALDGELWAGRGNFELVRVLVQTRRAGHPSWEQVKYMVFDAPTTDADVLEDRWKVGQKLARGAKVEWVRQERVASLAAMLARFNEVVASGGEGLVLRQPASYYEFQRSSRWLKVKPAHIS